MKDVAERADVSSSTVSFVLAGRSDMRIPDSTRQRVLDAARELNYRPNLMARGLRTKSSSTIGLVSNGIVTEPYASELIRGALTALEWVTRPKYDSKVFIEESEAIAWLARKLAAKGVKLVVPEAARAKSL